MLRKTKGTLDRTFSQGEHLIWLTGSALAVCLLMIAGLLVIVIQNGAGYFWPHALTQAQTPDGSILGVLVHSESFRKFNDTNSQVEVLRRSQFRIANRDVSGVDFKWFESGSLSNIVQPADAVALEREEYGDFYGYLTAVKESGRVLAEGQTAWAVLHEKHPQARQIARQRLHVQKVEIGAVNAAIQQASMDIRRAERRLPAGPERQAAIAKAQAVIQRQQAEFEILKARAGELQAVGQRLVAAMRTADGKEKDVPLSEIVRAFKPNAMS
ncbi:MAG TPA: hypothetical protein VJS65_00200, partial [Verrucomicrobiae bacterium]|nr:hypothetical protein [Verrucomicrobiae bacterium]